MYVKKEERPKGQPLIPDFSGLAKTNRDVDLHIVALDKNGNLVARLID
jgi:hypothetical protein